MNEIQSRDALLRMVAMSMLAVSRVLSVIRYLASLGLLGLLMPSVACHGPGAPSADTGAPSDRSFEFALLGDNPYPRESLPMFEALIDEVNLDTSLEWVIHVGDNQPCFEAWIGRPFEHGYEQFELRVQLPLQG